MRCPQTLMMPTAMSNMSMNDMVPEPLAGAINASFGNYTAFKMKMNEAGMGVFGSGALCTGHPCALGPLFCATTEVCTLSISAV
jgi:hypothetical protein